LSREDAILALVESVRSELKAAVDDVRSDISEVRSELKALAAKPSVPAWVRTVVIAALSAVAASLATKAVSHVQWAPTHDASQQAQR